MAPLAHISTWESATRVATACFVLQVCALQLPTAPPGLLHCFDITYLGPSGPEFGNLELHTASNHEPHGFILLYFPLTHSFIFSQY